jgi:predicted nucleic-acid-binding protein
MKSLDTNVLVRYYAQDDPEQSPIAARLFADEQALFVAKTVLILVGTLVNLPESFPIPEEPYHDNCNHRTRRSSIYRHAL